jgi:hypothetical protein
MSSDSALQQAIAQRDASRRTAQDLRAAAVELIDCIREYAELCRDCRGFIAGFADDAAQQPLVGQLLARLDVALPAPGEPFPWEHHAAPMSAHPQPATPPVPDLADLATFERATRPGELAA